MAALIILHHIRQLLKLPNRGQAFLIEQLNKTSGHLRHVSLTVQVFNIEPLVIWVRSRNCGCLVTWFCYQLIAKPGNKTATVPWPDPYALPHYLVEICGSLFNIQVDCYKSPLTWSSRLLCVETVDAFSLIRNRRCSVAKNINYIDSETTPDKLPSAAINNPGPL